MTNIEIAKIYRIRTILRGGVKTLFAAAFVASCSFAFAQDAVPDQNIRLPSVSEYSLPPGERKSEVNPVPGPVDETVPQPTRNPTPAPTQVTPPARTAPTPGANTSGSSERTTVRDGRAAPAPITDRPRPAPASRQQTRPAPPPQSQQETSRPEAALTVPANAIEPGADNAAPETAVDGALSTDNATGSEAEPTVEASGEEVSATGNGLPIVPIGLGVVALFAALAGLYFWKRAKVEQPSNADEFAGEGLDANIEKAASKAIAPDRAPAPSSPPSPKPRNPAPKIYSPPNPVAEPKAAPVSDSGFITTKVGLAPKAPEAPGSAQQIDPQIKPPQPPIKQSGDLKIDFVADKASSTLMNAVVGYQLVVTNEGKAAAEDLKIFADLIQADKKDALYSLVDRAVAAHQIDRLDSGEKITLSGDIRLPLSLIQPISINQQALFVPLARLNIDYKAGGKTKVTQSASYIVGREHEPPRPKMAPFRLDLGPRNFGPVGQRAVQI